MLAESTLLAVLVLLSLVVVPICCLLTILIMSKTSLMETLKSLNEPTNGSPTERERV